jgi:beta-mannosidase
VVLSNASLSGVRIDVYNDPPDSPAGELVLVATNFWVSERWRPDALFPYRAVLRSLSSIRLCRERSGTLSNSFRFGKPTADGIEAVVEFVGSPYMIRDALIVNPRPGQANSGIRALAYPSDETDWTLEISSDVALRYVSIDAPGWIPSDNFFHLVAATPYSVRLQRCCDQAAPLGKVASVDSLGTATITASA